MITTETTTEPRRELPRGWRLEKLAAVCELNPRRPTFQRNDETPTTFVPMPAVDENSGTITAPEVRPFGEVKKGYTYFAEDDVLFAKITPCMQNGKHAIACNLIDGVGFGSTEFHVIRPGSQVLPEWIHFFVRQPAVLKAAEAHFTGSVGQQRVPDEYLANLTLPLPPLPEQRRIAVLLNEQMAAVERARAAAEARLEAARALPAAYLREVFEGEEARGWKPMRLGSIAKTGSGTTPSRSNNTYYGGSIPWVKTGELADGIIEETEETVSELALKETSLRLLPAGTLLVAMYGQGKTRGRTGLLGRPATTNQACFAIEPNDAVFNPRFLQFWFRNNYGRLRQESEGRGGNQPNLNGDLLKNQIVPLPSLPNQNLVVAMLEIKLFSSKQAVIALEEQITSILNLPAALLRQAFSGEL